MISRRQALQMISTSSLAPWFTQALALAWPTRPIRIVIPFAVGGTADVVARLMAAQLSVAFGQPVVIDAKVGANGLIASDAVAKSPADGYTFLLASAAHASNASLYKKLPHDTVRDFVSVAQVVPPGPMAIAVNASLPVRTVRELIDYARANPGKITYASAGIGNSLHLAGEMFCQMANIQMLHVPYKGAAPALNDLAGGQVQLMFNSALALAPMVKEGRLRLIAQTGMHRSATLPADLPTVAESGLPGFEVTGWFGLFASARTPPEIVQRVNTEVNRAMALPELREKLALLGNSESQSLSPDAFNAFVNAEIARYARVIKTAGITLDTPAP